MDTNQVSAQPIVRLQTKPHHAQTGAFSDIAPPWRQSLALAAGYLSLKSQESRPPQPPPQDKKLSSYFSPSSILLCLSLHPLQ